MVRCLHPIKLRNPRYKDLSPLELDNVSEDIFGDKCIPDPLTGNFHPPDETLVVPCGRCKPCQDARRAAWVFRLSREYKFNQDKRNVLVTLTLNDDAYYYLVEDLATNHDDSRDVYTEYSSRWIKLFLDRVRKKYGYRPKYFIVSELGSRTARLHFHGIFFDVPPTFDTDLPNLWKYGFTNCGDVRSVKGITYCTKYLTKTVYNSYVFRPILRCSLRLGFRETEYTELSSALSRSVERGTTPVLFFGDRRYVVPRYYRNKLLSPTEIIQNYLNSVYSSVMAVNGNVYDDENLYNLALESEYIRSVQQGESLPIIKPINTLSPNNDF